MTDNHRKLVTIVTEAVLESALVRELDRLGAQGYTITEARGRGGRGSRTDAWDAGSNIRIEIVCNADTAATIAEHVQQKYYQDYAMILFTADIEVLRPDKF